MASLLNSGFSSGLNTGNYYNQGFSDQMSASAECIVTVNAQLDQSSILDPTGFKKDFRIITAKKQIIVKGV